ncbi:EYxxD motif small membrane protein [Desmospora profundinema]|uniref:Uncharacterized protein n=1 Tax=Desmospora profundinema TaxID=1571184 RepID=A0ABU1IM86_9BACL|nr:EYxxD motif small membrane protein [Desmospora profundinema]MDR6225885.1 hypothetical protein [Desmospora profundinema]
MEWFRWLPLTERPLDIWWLPLTGRPLDIWWLTVDRLVDNLYVVATIVGSLVMVVWMVDWIWRKRRARS